jgi:hypothetical protein
VIILNKVESFSFVLLLFSFHFSAPISKNTWSRHKKAAIAYSLVQVCFALLKKVYWHTNKLEFPNCLSAKQLLYRHISAPKRN